MLHQVSLRDFLHGALLVGVTSARDCYICGDGYQVGSPSAITSVRFQEQTDTQLTCSDLQFAGLEGLIPSEECSALPSLIFETCDCQEKTRNILRTSEDTNSLRGSAYSSRRRTNTWFASPAAGTSPPLGAPIGPGSSPPVGAPTFLRPSVSGPSFAPAPAAKPPGQAAPVDLNSPVLSPVFTTSFDPISYGYLPSSNIPPVAAPTQPAVDQSVIIVVSIIASVLLLAFVARSATRMNIPQSNATPLSLPTQGNGRRIQATPTTTLPMISQPTPMLLKQQTLARRPMVLAVLFPDQGKTEGAISGRSLKYDAQSKRYVFSEDTPEATTCSICLEFLVPEDDAVTGLCSHVYHRECIMNWLQGGHDQCPNCRQPMWDPETYKMVDQEIKDQNTGSSSSRDVIAVC